MRVLIADCDSEFLDLARRFLSQCGHEAMVASNGVECMTCLRNSAPEMVVLDGELLWGGSDGVREFMNEEPGLDVIPLILVSDELQDSRTGSGADSLVVDRLRKPYSLTHLIGRIQACETNRLGCLA